VTSLAAHTFESAGHTVFRNRLIFAADCSDYSVRGNCATFDFQGGMQTTVAPSGRDACQDRRALLRSINDDIRRSTSVWGQHGLQT